MKVEIEIPDGKYCKDCKLYHCGNELGYLCGYTGNQLAHDDERISEFGFKYHFIKDNQCPITNGIPYSPDFTRNKILLEIANMLDKKDWFGKALTPNERLIYLDFIKYYRT